MTPILSGDYIRWSQVIDDFFPKPIPVAIERFLGAYSKTEEFAVLFFQDKTNRIIIGMKVTIPQDTIVRVVPYTSEIGYGLPRFSRSRSYRSFMRLMDKEILLIYQQQLKNIFPTINLLQNKDLK